MQVSQRRLPHFYVIGQPLFVTFHLHGSLPRGREFTRESMASGRAFACMDRLLDRQLAGPLHLRRPQVAQLVVDYFEQGAKTDYVLHAWVVMPNHVHHMLITPQTDVSRLLQKLKGYTAREANKLLGGTGKPSGRTRVTTGWFAARKSSGGFRSTLFKIRFGQGWSDRRTNIVGQAPGTAG